MEGSLPRPLAGETVTMCRAGAGGSGVVCASAAKQPVSRKASEESFIFDLTSKEASSEILHRYLEIPSPCQLDRSASKPLSASRILGAKWRDREDASSTMQPSSHTLSRSSFNTAAMFGPPKKIVR